MPDVLLVTLGSTAGLRTVERELEGSLRRAGATVAVARARPARDVPTFALTDLVQARAARAAAEAALTRERARAVLYSTTTAALLWPVPGAIQFDAPAAGNRPGRHGLWQRAVERRRFAHAPLLVCQSEGGLAEAPPTETPSLVVPVPVQRSGETGGERDIAAVAYAADAAKKGLDRILAAWATARQPGERLVVAGATGELGEGVEATGPLEPEAFRALLRCARVYVTAPRREDYGLAQLEALADGAMLVTTPAPGPYVALGIARDLDERLVSDDLAVALRAALDSPAQGYTERAAAALAPFTRQAVDEVVASRLLPSLLGGA